MNGLLLIDKPAGFTSNQVLNLLKRKMRTNPSTSLRAGKMGHTGTLDPFATGLLIVALGQATKLIPSLNDEPKVYEATLKLGEATDTMDCDGKVIETKLVPLLDESQIKQVFKSFMGKSWQIPPMYSAKKIGGRKLYELARKGIEVERKPVGIEIYELDLIATPSNHRTIELSNHQAIHFRVSCSRGTYVRVLGTDIAKALGTVGHLVSLRRLAAGPFRVEDAVGLDGPFTPHTADTFSSFSKNHQAPLSNRR